MALGNVIYFVSLYSMLNLVLRTSPLAWAGGLSEGLNGVVSFTINGYYFGLATANG